MSPSRGRALRVFLAVSLVALTGAAPPRPAGRLDWYGDPLPEGASARLGSMRLRHSAKWLAISPDGHTLASYYRDLRLWDLRTGRLVRRFDVEDVFGHSLVYSPDGKRLVSFRRGQIVVWELETGKRRYLGTEDALPGAPTGAAFDPTGRTLAVCVRHSVDEKEPGHVHLFDVRTGEERAVWRPHGGGPEAPVFSPDGRTLAFATGSVLRLWDVGRGKETTSIEAGKTIQSVAFSRDGRRVAVHGETMPLQAFDPRTRDLLLLGPVSEGHPNVLQFTRDDRAVLVGGMFDPLRAVDLDARKAPRVIVPVELTWPTAISPDGRVLVHGVGDALHVWDVQTGRRRFAFADHRDRPTGYPIEAVASPDGKRVATWTPTEVRIWERATGKPLLCITSEDFLPGIQWAGSRHIAVASWRVMTWWDADTGQPTRHLPLLLGGLEGARLTNDGRWIVGYRNPRSRGREDFLLDASTGQVVRRIESSWPRDEVAAIAPDGWHFLLYDRSQRGEGRASLFRLSSNIPAWRRPAGNYPEAIAFSVNGRWAARLGLTGLYVWDVPSGQRIGSSPTFLAPLLWDSTRQASVSPDGRTVAAGLDLRYHLLTEGRDSFSRSTAQVELFETATGLVRRSLPPIDGAVACSFAPDGRSILTASNDGTVLVWDTYALPTRARPALPADPTLLWDHLASPDARLAFDVVCRLRAAPSVALGLLRERLRPTRFDPPAVRRWLADLEDGDFARRQAARAALLDQGDDIAPAVRAALEATPDLEFRARLEELLDEMGRGGGAPGRRQTRAVEVLEQVGGAEAVRLLRHLATGHPDARLTREALRALAHLR